MKRSRENQAPTTPNKKQTTLLSMFKPVVTAPVVTAPKVTDGVENTAEASDEVAGTTAKKRDPKDLFKGASQETLELLDLEITTMNYEWLKVLAPEMTKPYFLKLKRYLKAELAAKKTIFPPLNQIYSWSNYTPPSKVKVVILGQDPYHNFNQAHGLCFSVVKGVKVPPSLVNMYKALSMEYSDFKIPNHGYLEEWAKQGVLLLNTSLSVEAHKAGSHANQGWEQFTDAIIKYLNEKKANIVFMLWGSHAQKKGARINKSKHHVLTSVHPSPLSAHRGFFECKHFSKANAYLKEHGNEEINWNCLV
ncbi:uracil-DNA glycosylase [Mucor ambiguus]|uniref:Uracil-DNA glycosylase n=1 Tax=Mucor ambiguus TaxID=91626 RepID=A0A0C9LYK6_9FUNG|nr:uracil-DNA glycosylase [Mucor ambiguus]